jgi:transcription elongation factor GreB
MGRYRKPTPPGSPYITGEGEKKLQEELHQLWKIERPQVTQAVHEAAKNGDRSENGDYIYGKKRLREIDSRVRYLSKRLEQLKVIDHVPTDQKKIYFGAWVTLENDAGEEIVYRIVGPDEFDISKGLLSMDSPIAKLMLGKRIDDEFRLTINDQIHNFVVVKIEYKK